MSGFSFYFSLSYPDLIGNNLIQITFYEQLPPSSHLCLLPGLYFTPNFLCLLPTAAQGDREGGLFITYSLCHSFLPVREC